MIIAGLALITVSLAVWIFHTPASNKRGGGRALTKHAHRRSAPPAIRGTGAEMFRNVR